MVNTTIANKVRITDFNVTWRNCNANKELHEKLNVWAWVISCIPTLLAAADTGYDALPISFTTLAHKMFHNR